MKRLVRYILQYPREVWEFPYQEEPQEVTVLTDSDWAGDKATRKSMSSYVERFGHHMIDASCNRQSVVALSSGEAEFYAITRGAAAGRMTVQMWGCIGFKNLPLVIRTDSNAAKGICNRKGVGKVKHLDLKELWVQDSVAKGEFTVVKEPTQSNWADLMTKPLAGPRVSELVKMMPLRRGLQAAIVASCVSLVRAQSEEETPSYGAFWIYMIALHLVVFVFICQMIYRLCRSPRIAVQVSKGVQTDELGPRPTATGSRAASSSGAHGLHEGHGGEANLRQRGHTVFFFKAEGKKYHYAWCGLVAEALQNKPSRLGRLSLEEARRRGLKPCQSCCVGEG